MDISFREVSLVDIKVSDVLAAITSGMAPIDNTVDGLLAGSLDTTVKGIAVTFLATQEIIEKARDMGVNLIISHEGIYFSHRDKRDQLGADQVYIDKSSLLEECGMSVIRCHDYIHRQLPDRVTKGLVRVLGWESLEVENRDIVTIVEIPEMTLQQLISHIKQSLGISHLRYVGHPEMLCRCVGVLVGYRGSGDSVIPIFSKDGADLVICGEGPEWEAPEYVRDAVYQKKNRALIVLGHAESESPGMEYYTELLQNSFPNIPVHYIKYDPIFRLG
jgi:putative NIF3 family GTP cyclohydrolase 1 type 2